MFQPSQLTQTSQGSTFDQTSQMLNNSAVSLKELIHYCKTLEKNGTITEAQSKKIMQGIEFGDDKRSVSEFREDFFKFCLQEFGRESKVEKANENYIEPIRAISNEEELTIYRYLDGREVSHKAPENSPLKGLTLEEVSIENLFFKNKIQDGVLFLGSASENLKKTRRKSTSKSLANEEENDKKAKMTTETSNNFNMR